MRMFSTTEWYSSSFRKPSRGEKPLHKQAASEETEIAVVHRKLLNLPNNEKLDVTGISVTAL